VAFDDAYLEYLDLFILWKLHDASSLEADLVAMAAKLEASLLRKLGGGGGPGTPRRARAEEDLRAMVAQVGREQLVVVVVVVVVGEGGGGCGRLVDGPPFP
jgi:hypothetical protein